MHDVYANNRKIIAIRKKKKITINQLLHLIQDILLLSSIGNKGSNALSNWLNF